MDRKRRSRGIVLTACVAFCAAWCSAHTASAATLVGIVSQRSAPELAAAADRFTERHPGHALVLRTPEQLAAHTDEEVAKLWRNADCVLLAAVFGDQAPRLARLLREAPPPPSAAVLALHGDDRLTRVSRLDGTRVFEEVSKDAFHALTLGLGSDQDWPTRKRDLEARYPATAPWLQARGYWLARGTRNLSRLLAWLLAAGGAELPAPPAPQPRGSLRFLHEGKLHVDAPPALPADRLTVAVLDYDYGDRQGDRHVHRTLCEGLQERGLGCLRVLARWGEASVQALQALRPAARKGRLAGVVVLQDFVVGGGSGREHATRALRELDVPVVHGIRLRERGETQWRLSRDGVPWDSVHYRVAMPELQGQIEPIVVAAAGPAHIHEATGLRLRITQPIEEEIASLAERMGRWAALRHKPNAEKRVAVIYYNHPPGRQNIGADNLDVPASLLRVLQLLKKAGYTTGEVPADAEALLEQMQERGVNLPENREALRAMAPHVRRLEAEPYRDYFASLPERLRAEVRNGPLAALATRVREALEAGEAQLAENEVQHTLEDVRHLLEGLQHPASTRASKLLDALENAFSNALDGQPDWKRIDTLVRALRQTGIEGLRGWGAAPGRVMTHDETLLLPGLEYGNVFVGPQPPRGWELDEELLHANLAFPPTHHYLAYYHWLREVWKADVVVHLGRHSTYEFLPGKRAGLSADDYSRRVLGALPSVYVYIVDGVGEGIQAKRRGLATIVDHLTPSLQTTPLYDRLLELRQLVESYESSAHRDPRKARRAVAQIRGHVADMELEAELLADAPHEHGSIDALDDELLVHEVGHYLTHMQEQFMPFGLHVFGKPWSEQAVERMLASMAQDGRPQPQWRRALKASPGHERRALLAALEGRFVAPGPGNDPVRTPEALPTGRNFHALDASVLPTKLAWELGAELAAEARAQRAGTPEGSEALVLWASDTVRDDGAMVAFGLSMLGVRPVWSRRGIMQGLRRIEMPEDRARRDVTFVTSGLFRDLYGHLIAWLDRAALLALDASSAHIRREHPELQDALGAALEPLGEYADPGDESLEVNQVAAHWVARAQDALDKGEPAAKAGRHASLRVFGNAPGGYGAGINRLAERSGSWSQRKELGRAYLHRLGHAYGVDIQGEPAHESFRARLQRTEHTFLGRASHLYGLLDNNDGFDYLGGLNLAVERVRGKAPHSRVIRHADPDASHLQPLTEAVLQELRGRHLNPEYLEALMQHGYAGARTMGTEFLENLWGWQVTSPDIVKPWAWDQVRDVYFQDKHGIGLDEFLEQGRNVHVKTQMEAILLVAAHKGFWQPDDATLKELAQRFAEHVTEHGLPGSGHTRPDHPMMDLVRRQLHETQRRRFAKALRAAKQPEAEPTGEPSAVAEVQEVEPRDQGPRGAPWMWAVGASVLALFAGGIAWGRRGGRR